MSIDFLGSKANFPTGGVVLAHILKMPLMSMTCWREKSAPLTDRKATNCYHVRFAGLADEVILSRKNRQKDCEKLMSAFVRELELALSHSPFDWFNFYRFWSKS